MGRPLLYGYDSRGNMISAPDGTDYAYDAMDRLIDVDLPDTTHIDYTYDWDGRRIQKDVDSGTEVINYLWDEFSIYGDAVLETDETNAVLGNYTLANGQLISQTRSGTDRFYLADGQGSIRALVDDAATVNVTDNYTYKAFGEILISNETTENAHRFTGQQFDKHIGLYSLRARYYNPNVGRFLTRDTYPFDFENPMELNRYVYVSDNPINSTDPSGLCGNCIEIGLINVNITTVAILVFTGYAYYLAMAYVDVYIETLAAVQNALFAKKGKKGKGGKTSDDETEWSPETKVSEILKKKLGSIKNAALPRGAPSWKDMIEQGITWGDIVEGAQKKLVGYGTIKKLLGAKRFDK